MSLTLAIDIGSSSVRAMLFAEGGRALESVFVQKRYTTRTTSDGGAMIDPLELAALTYACVDEALQQAGDVVISRVAMDTFVANVLGIGADGRPVTPVYTWADTRGAALGKQMTLEDYTRRTGCRIHTSYWPVRLLWLREHEPDAFAASVCWLSLGDFILHQIFGQRRMSYSTASWSGLFNRHTLDWDTLTLQQIDLDAQHLPELNNAPLHGLSATWAERWPALRDAQWFPSVGDGVASNIGGDCAQSGYVALSLGTSGAMRVVVPGTPAQTPDGLFVYRIDAQRSLVGGALSNAGNLYAWLNKTLNVGDDAALQAAVGRITPDGHGLTVLPFLAGERAPGWNAQAKAVYMGMTFDTQPEHMVRAALEAVAYRFYQIYRRLKPLLPNQITFIANGAGLVNSPVWMQIMADVLGAPVYASAQAEATIRGAALLAEGTLPAPEIGQGCQPNMNNHRIYQAAIERQQALYQRLLG